MIRMGASTKQQDSNESKKTQQDNSNQDSLLAILELMNNYAQKLSFSVEKKIVFVLGNTGAGMTISAINFFSICYRWYVWMVFC